MAKCPMIDLCYFELYQHTYNYFCATDRYKNCCYYPIVSKEERKTPEKWKKEIEENAEV